MFQRKLSNTRGNKCLLILVGIGMTAMLTGNVARADLTSSCWMESGDGTNACCLGWSRTATPDEVCANSRDTAGKTPKSDSYAFENCNYMTGCEQGEPREVTQGQGTPVTPS